MSREHEREPNRKSIVIVSAGTRHDYQVGTVVEVAGPPGLPSRRASLVDSIVGRLGGDRPAKMKAYRPACRAVPNDATWVFLHNAVPPLSEMAKHRPGVGRAPLDPQRIVPDLRPSGDASLSGPCRSGPLLQPFHRRPRRGAGANGGRFSTGRPQRGGYREVPAPRRWGHRRGTGDLVRGTGRRREGSRPPAQGGHPHRFQEATLPGPHLGSRGFAATLPLSPYEQELRHLAAPLGSDVEFVPFVARDAIPDLYRSASIFCVPANWDEPFGLTTLEGMASGLAVVAAPRGGIPEIGADSVSYVDPTDTDRLAGALADLLDDPTGRAQLGARARARAEDLSWTKQYQKLRDALSAERG